MSHIQSVRIILLLLLFVPSLLSASGSESLTITEIMYDPVGTDSGREWVEILAPGQVDSLGSYYLRENEVNHGVKLYEGHTPTGESDYAIIADNPTKFLVDFPQYTGYIYDSAFSLKNTGEDISLVSKDQDVLFTYTYEPVEETYDVLWTLQYDTSSDGWIPGQASPGTGDIVSIGTASSGGEDKQVSKASKRQDIEEYPAHKTIQEITLQKEIHGIVSIPVRFNPYSVESLKVSNHKMHWSYGDGSSEFTDRPSHTYVYPGEYLLVGSVNEGKDFEHIAYGKVIIRENPVILKEINNEVGYVEVENTSSTIVNIEKFRINLGDGKVYVFPNNTLILGMGSIKVPFSTLNTFQRGVDYNNTDSFTLEYPRIIK